MKKSPVNDKPKTLQERFAKALLAKKELAEAGITYKKKMTLKERLAAALKKMFEKKMTIHIKQ